MGIWHSSLGLVGRLGGWVCPAAICRNGPRLRKPWRSGIKVCAQSFCTHLCMCGSVAAGRLYTKYRAGGGGGKGVWQ